MTSLEWLTLESKESACKPAIKHIVTISSSCISKMFINFSPCITSIYIFIRFEDKSKDGKKRFRWWNLFALHTEAEVVGVRKRRRRERKKGLIIRLMCEEKGKFLGEFLLFAIVRSPGNVNRKFLNILKKWVSKSEEILKQDWCKMFVYKDKLLRFYVDCVYGEILQSWGKGHGAIFPRDKTRNLFSIVELGKHASTCVSSQRNRNDNQKFDAWRHLSEGWWLVAKDFNLPYIKNGASLRWLQLISCQSLPHLVRFRCFSICRRR